MLLIDGARYELWTPQKEVEEFHPIVKDHIQEIFGERSMFIEANKLVSDAGKGSKPDGFVIIFEEKPEWHVLEMELSCHDVYKHIVDQVGRFITGVGSTATQRKIVEAIYHEISQSNRRKADAEEKIGSGEIYKYLNDLISSPPVLTIIIEEKTPELEEALSLFQYSPIKIIEFKTFRRVGADIVHAHLFGTLYQAEAIVRDEQNNKILSESGKEVSKTQSLQANKKITFQDLIEAGYLKDGQVLYLRFHNQLVDDEQAQVVLRPNSLKYHGQPYKQSPLAKNINSRKAPFSELADFRWSFILVHRKR